MVCCKCRANRSLGVSFLIGSMVYSTGNPVPVLKQLRQCCMWMFGYSPSSGEVSDESQVDCWSQLCVRI